MDQNDKWHSGRSVRQSVCSTLYLFFCLGGTNSQDVSSVFWKMILTEWLITVWSGWTKVWIEFNDWLIASKFKVLYLIGLFLITLKLTPMSISLDVLLHIVVVLLQTITSKFVKNRNHPTASVKNCQRKSCWFKTWFLDNSCNIGQ